MVLWRVLNPKLFKVGALKNNIDEGGIKVSELRLLAAVALAIGIIVGLTAYFVFHIPDVYCVVLGFASGAVFFFIILWSSYVFLYH